MVLSNPTTNSPHFTEKFPERVVFLTESTPSLHLLAAEVLSLRREWAGLIYQRSALWKIALEQQSIVKGNSVLLLNQSFNMNNFNNRNKNRFPLYQHYL